MKESNYNNQKGQKLTTLTSHTNNFSGKLKNTRGVCKIQPKTGERNFDVTNTDSRPRKTVRLIHIPLDALFQQELQMNYDQGEEECCWKESSKVKSTVFIPFFHFKLVL